MDFREVETHGCWALCRVSEDGGRDPVLVHQDSPVASGGMGESALPQGKLKRMSHHGQGKSHDANVCVHQFGADLLLLCGRPHSLRGKLVTWGGQGNLIRVACCMPKQADCKLCISQGASFSKRD